MEEAKGTCRTFLDYLSKENWAGAHDLLAEEFQHGSPSLVKQSAMVNLMSKS